MGGLLVAVPSLALAQAPPSRATPPAPNAPPAASRDQNCAPTQTVPGKGTLAPEGQTTGQSRENLGDKLAKSGGVLCPPAGVDPEMHAPTPQDGNTPIIPPPGSPGGDQSVQPK